MAMLLEHTEKHLGKRRLPDLEATEWAIGRQRIIQGDCQQALRGLGDGTIDVIVTSPPYNIGVAYKTYQDRQPRDTYLEWLADIGRELNRVMKDDASFFLNIGSTNSDPWIAQDVAEALRTTFSLQNHIVWVKSISIGDDTVGHFKPITSQRFLNHNHEAIFHYTKSGSVPVDRVAIGVPFKDKSNIARWGHKADRRCAGNVWFLP
jgi:site-specific DNA-methyltransferase (adenine-specific)